MKSDFLFDLLCVTLSSCLAACGLWGQFLLVLLLVLFYVCFAVCGCLSWQQPFFVIDLHNALIEFPNGAVEQFPVNTNHIFINS